MKEKIIALLKENSKDFLSGEEISKKLNVTRAAVWKHINELKNNGYDIESKSNKGYKLISSPDILKYEEIKKYIKTKYIGSNIIHYDEIDSTNNQAKKLADDLKGEGHVVVAESQSQGRGRLGRQWMSSNNSGIWMSIILRPKIDIYDVAKITQVAAASVQSALFEIGIKALIKWPNDIMINGKKVCGILTEMSSELNAVNYVVVGIGINVNSELQQFSKELQSIATSLKIESGRSVDRRELIALIFNNFEKFYDEFCSDNFEASLRICKENSYVIGRNVDIIKAEKVFSAKVLDLTQEGALIVQYDNGYTEELISGEISVKLSN